jgi:hypothetical protein
MAAQVAQKEGFGIDEISLKPLQKVGVIIGALKSGQKVKSSNLPKRAIISMT